MSKQSWGLDRDGNVIATPSRYFDPPIEIAKVNDRTNARLIASAPSLLKALQDMVCAFEGSDRSNHPALEAAKEVIAKAVGRE